MKLIRTLTWTGVFAAGVFLGGITHGATAHASAVLQSSSSQSGQSGQNSQSGKETEPASITGELTRVNPQAMTFSVKSASGAEMLFRYDDKTMVTGAESSVAGLATSNGSEVTVTYRNENAGNMASKIEVHGKK